MIVSARSPVGQRPLYIHAVHLDSRDGSGRVGLPQTFRSTVRCADSFPSPAKSRFQGGRATEAEILAELPDDWRAPVPVNPSPAEECAAWEADVGTVREAALIARYRRRLRNG